MRKFFTYTVNESKELTDGRWREFEVDENGEALNVPNGMVAVKEPMKEGFLKVENSEIKEDLSKRDELEKKAIVLSMIPLKISLLAIESLKNETKDSEILSILSSREEELKTQLLEIM